MRARILVLFAIFLSAVALITFLSFRTGRILSSSNQGISKIAGDFTEVQKQLTELRFAVAESFARENSESADKDFLKAKERLTNISSTLTNISGDTSYSEILASYKVKVPAVQNATADADAQKSSPDSSPALDEKPVREVLISVQNHLELLKTELNNLQAAVKEMYATAESLETERKALNQLYRELPVSSWASLFPEQWPDIYRAVLTVLSSSSRRDLKFAGEGRFNKAIETMEKSLGKNEAFQKFKEQFEKTARFASQSATITSAVVYSKFSAEFFELTDFVDRLAVQSGQWNNQSKLDMISSAGTQNNVSIMISFFVMVFGSLLVWLTTSRIVGQLRAVLQSVMTQSNKVAQVSTTVATASQTLGQNVHEQGATIHETVAAMKEISTMIARTNDQAQSARSITGELTQRMVELQHANIQLKTIVDTFEEIEEKTQVINQIVFKTQLLSFNASIEATRAGTHGKGFAVVAQEVGKLAEMSGSAAKEINNLLKKSSGGVRKSVDMASSVISEVETGVKKIRDSAESIAQASLEQQTGVEETNRSMDRMYKLTERNSKNAETLTAVAGDLNSGSDAIQVSLGQLKEVVDGQGTSAAVSETAKLAMEVANAAGERINSWRKKSPQVDTNIATISHKVPSSKNAGPEQGAQVPPAAPITHEHDSFKKVG